MTAPHSSTTSVTSPTPNLAFSVLLQSLSSLFGSTNSFSLLGVAPVPALSPPSPPTRVLVRVVLGLSLLSSTQGVVSTLLRDELSSSSFARWWKSGAAAVVSERREA